jgi:hypothetical protein
VIEPSLPQNCDPSADEERQDLTRLTPSADYSRDGRRAILLSASSVPRVQYSLGRLIKDGLLGSVHLFPRGHLSMCPYRAASLFLCSYDVPFLERIAMYIPYSLSWFLAKCAVKVSFGGYAGVELQIHSDGSLFSGFLA